MSAATRYGLAVAGGKDPGLQVANYLPSNYEVTGVDGDHVYFSGVDNAGWTLDGYVIPRLGSGWISAREVKPPRPEMLVLGNNELIALTNMLIAAELDPEAATLLGLPSPLPKAIHTVMVEGGATGDVTPWAYHFWRREMNTTTGNAGYLYRNGGYYIKDRKGRVEHRPNVSAFVWFFGWLVPLLRGEWKIFLWLLAMSLGTTLVLTVIWVFLFIYMGEEAYMAMPHNAIGLAIGMVYNTIVANLYPKWVKDQAIKNGRLMHDSPPKF